MAGGFAVLDGNWGWGQVVAKEAMEYGIKKALGNGAGNNLRQPVLPHRARWEIIP